MVNLDVDSEGESWGSRFYLGLEVLDASARLPAALLAQ